MIRHIQKPRGFTLIEAMVVVTVVGVLASIAIPEYTRATLRSRATERKAIMETVGRAVNDLLAQQDPPQLPPSATDPHPKTWQGVDNPPEAPNVLKHKFDLSADGWTGLPIVLEGSSYYSYSFLVLDEHLDGTETSMTVTGTGDIDGDGQKSTVIDAFIGPGYLLVPDPDPAAYTKEDPIVF
jgi:prepilin-type N-terminal cleavage/methylation domain-containing protein